MKDKETAIAIKVREIIRDENGETGTNNTYVNKNLIDHMSREEWLEIRSYYDNMFGIR